METITSDFINDYKLDKNDCNISRIKNYYVDVITYDHISLMKRIMYSILPLEECVDIAISNNSYRCLNLLISDMNLNNVETYLICAMNYRSLNCVKVLLCHSSCQRDFSDTLMYSSIMNSSKDIALLMLEDSRFTTICITFNEFESIIIRSQENNNTNLDQILNHPKITMCSSISRKLLNVSSYLYNKHSYFTIKKIVNHKLFVPLISNDHTMSYNDISDKYSDLFKYCHINGINIEKRFEYYPIFCVKGAVQILTTAGVKSVIINKKGEITYENFAANGSIPGAFRWEINLACKYLASMKISSVNITENGNIVDYYI